MSLKIAGAVWGANLHPTTRFILLALADHADHDGGNVRPGMELLEWKTGYGRSSIRAAISDLKARGILTTEVNAAGGRGNEATYRINLEAIEHTPRPHKTVQNMDTLGAKKSPQSGRFRPVKCPKNSQQSVQEIDLKCPKNGRTDTGTPFNEPSGTVIVDTPNVVSTVNRQNAREKTTESSSEKSSFFDLRENLFLAYCAGAGIRPDSAEFLSRRAVSLADLSTEIVSALDPGRLEEMTRYTIANWTAAGITSTPALKRVLEKEAEFDRWEGAGRPQITKTSRPAAAPERPMRNGRAGMTLEELRNLSGVKAISEGGT